MSLFAQAVAVRRRKYLADAAYSALRTCLRPQAGYSPYAAPGPSLPDPMSLVHKVGTIPGLAAVGTFMSTLVVQMMRQPETAEALKDCLVSTARNYPRLYTGTEGSLTTLQVTTEIKTSIDTVAAVARKLNEALPVPIPANQEVGVQTADVLRTKTPEVQLAYYNSLLVYVGRVLNHLACTAIKCGLSNKADRDSISGNEPAQILANFKTSTDQPLVECKVESIKDVIDKHNKEKKAWQKQINALKKAIQSQSGVKTKAEVIRAMQTEIATKMPRSLIPYVGKWWEDQKFQKALNNFANTNYQDVKRFYDLVGDHILPENLYMSIIGKFNDSTRRDVNDVVKQALNEKPNLDRWEILTRLADLQVYKHKMKKCLRGKNHNETQQILKAYIQLPFTIEGFGARYPTIFKCLNE